jgi:hypothetical protein
LFDWLLFAQQTLANNTVILQKKNQIQFVLTGVVVSIKKSKLQI